MHSKQANDAVASERSIFSKITIIIYKSFPCHGEHVRTYISGSRCTWQQKNTKRHSHTRGTTIIKII